MASAIKVDYDRMDEAASEMLAQWDLMVDSIDRITNVVRRIPEFWEADTAVTYVMQYDDLKPGLDRAAQLIQDIAEQMKQIASNFQETDADMAGQM